jgi:hypothetical protein
VVKLKVIKVTKNQWGNYRGRVSGDRLTTELGGNDWDAKIWAANKLNELPGSVISPLSYFSLDDVKGYL